jgi:hypothetical protein
MNVFLALIHVLFLSGYNSTIVFNAYYLSDVISDEDHVGMSRGIHLLLKI